MVVMATVAAEAHAGRLNASAKRVILKGCLRRKVGGLTLAALMLTGITFFSASDASAQRRGFRRGVVVRPVRIYRPYYGYGIRPFGWGGYGYYNNWYGDSFYNPYNQYVFSNPEDAAQTAYSQGFRTGEEDGRKNKSFSFERSHYYKEAGFSNFAEVYRRNFSRGYRGGFETGSGRSDS